MKSIGECKKIINMQAHSKHKNEKKKKPMCPLCLLVCSATNAQMNPDVLIIALRALGLNFLPRMHG